MVNKTKSKRIFYFDALRTLAICSVLIFHVATCTKSMVFAEYAAIPSVNWLISCFLTSTFHVGVCTFLMLSGALSLGREWDIKSFLGKRLPRIIYPFIFWGTLLSVILIAIYTFFPGVIWHNATLGEFSSYTVWGFLSYLKNTFLSINPSFTQYWFFWMILGTYLIMPVLNKWLLHADLKEAEYFICLWLITCIFTYTLGYDFPVQLNYFTGSIGLVVLGYYFRHTERNIFNNPYFGILLIIIGIALSMSVEYMLSSPKGQYIPDRYSIFNIIEVMGVFLFFKNYSKLNIKSRFIDSPDGVFRKSVFSIAKYSYGIYLIHLFVRNILRDQIKNLMTYKPLVFFLIVGTIGLSWLIMALANRVPYLNQIIGAK